MNKNLGASNTGAIIVIVLIIALAVVFGLLRGDKNNDQEPQTNTNQNTGQQNMMSRVEMNLTAQNNSGQSGKVVLSEENGKTKVVIDVTPGPKGVSQPAHLHAGDCSSLGAIKYELSDVVDGHSETILAPSLHFIHGLGKPAINFHKSRAEINVYSGCGNLLEALNDAMHTGSSGEVQGAIQNEGEIEIQ